MFVLKEMPAQLPAALIDKLARVETATIGHVLHGQFADRGIQAVLPDRRIAGTAVTLRIPGPDSTLLHHAMGLVRPGDVLVIDRCGDSVHACWGGVITNCAHNAGLAGGIIDGPATDFAEVRRLGFPLWCRGPSPITTKILGLEGALNLPVSVGGVAVEPGDAVLADESGVVFLKPHQAEAIADRALEMQAREVTLLERLRAGERLGEISGASRLVADRLAR
ncbi:MAG: 4-hydroxy-4-methyl-2-oxoglutarate aldolase [Paracoccaceae bacterium]|nr:MAG: 4-hydroxy-4-methyl-2-oxoglutarate aldolase [Paracoccaceae bacterium]